MDGALGAPYPFTYRGRPCSVALEKFGLRLYLGRDNSSLDDDSTIADKTVAYRAARIEAITGLDFDDPDDRLVAHVVVKIIESQGSAAI